MDFMPLLAAQQIGGGAILLIVIIGILIPELRDDLLSVHLVNIQNTFLLSDIPELRHGKRIDIN